MSDPAAESMVWPATSTRSGSARCRLPVSGGALGGMTPIATPLAASGFSPRALAVLDDRFRPLGLAPMAGGARARASDPRGGG